jgi:DNA-binding PucR family transcriptional regulator
MRQGAQVGVSGLEPWLRELHKATMASDYVRTIADDPVIAEAIRQSNRSNLLHWLAANVAHPGTPVAANLDDESLIAARDVVRHGLDEAAIVDAYRVAHNMAWRYWLQIAFALTSDADELRELLDLSARSLASFIDETVSAVCHQIRIERNELTRGTHAQRRQTIALIIDGAPIIPKHIEDRLGYEFGQSHTAAVIWGDEFNTNLSDLDRVADILIRNSEGRALSVLADARTRWVWLPGAGYPDLSGVAAELNQRSGVRMAVGPTAAGIEGFRSSHLDAITVQRMMARLGSPQRLAIFTDIYLIALISSNPEHADRFIKQTLGDFESADAELQRTVLTFVYEQCNAARTAELLYTHRNTVLRRITRANELLPRPLEKDGVHIAVALEALHWRGVSH